MPMVCLEQRPALGGGGTIAVRIRPGHAALAILCAAANPFLIGPLVEAFLEAKFLKPAHYGRLKKVSMTEIHALPPAESWNK